jgi:hypothetical protein
MRDLFRPEFWRELRCRRVIRSVRLDLLAAWAVVPTAQRRRSP